jgi:hypothetical protein
MLGGRSEVYPRSRASHMDVLDAVRVLWRSVVYLVMRGEADPEVSHSSEEARCMLGWHQLWDHRQRLEGG